MVAEKRSYTYADYERLPEGAPYQLIAGELVMSPAPAPYHQKFVMRLAKLLSEFAEERDAGEVFVSPIDVYFDPRETYQPDVVFVAKERLDIIGERKIEGAPDLVMEVLSVSNAYYDLRHKKDIYERYGVKEYWIVDALQEGAIEVWANEGGEFRLFHAAKGAAGVARSKLLEGFEARLASVFAPFRR